MINLVKISLLLSSFCVFAGLSPNYTTRLLSTGGAGAGSILVDEASILNPASIVFIPVTNFYFQQSKSETKQTSKDRLIKSDDSHFEIYQIADSSAELKGTFSYQVKSQNGFRRKMLVSSVAAAVGKKTSMGIIYSYNKLQTPTAGEETFHQASIGLTHIFNNKLSMGVVLKDPFYSNPEESVAITGFQYSIFKSLTVMQDFDYALKNKDSTGVSFRSAVQINAFADFYLRAGKFDDKVRHTTGTSYGIFWIGPKLSLGYALMKSEFTQDTDSYFRGEEDIESSLSVSIRI